MEDECDNVDGGPDVPRGVIRSRKGWMGDEMEMEHQRQSSKKRTATDDEDDDDDGNNGSSSKRQQRYGPTAVDIRQFQNHVVGEGYQARHVIRQKTVNTGTSTFNSAHGTTATRIRSSAKVVDMTGGVFKNKNGTGTDTMIPSTSSSSFLNQDPSDYIKNKSLRQFRLEIEKILSSS